MVKRGSSQLRYTLITAFDMTFATYYGNYHVALIRVITFIDFNSKTSFPI